MKCVCTSDLHGYFPIIEPCDLLIIAGDICPIKSDKFALRTHDKRAQIEWIITEFLDWCAKVPAREIVWIAGNHDFGPEDRDFRKTFERERQQFVHYLQDESIEIYGKKVYGMPWTPNLPNWAFYASEKAWSWFGEDIPADTDILVLHSPPSGVMLDGGHPDWASPYILTDIVQRVQPELCVFGHIHEGYGEIVLKGTTFANVAYCDAYYDPIQPPKVFELDYND